MPFLLKNVPLPTVTVDCPSCSQPMTIRVRAVFDGVDDSTTPATAHGGVYADTQHACQAPAGS